MKLINYTQAAKELKCSRPTIYKMIERGQLQTVEIADRKFLKLEEVRTLIKE